MSKYFADTFVFLALLNPNDSSHSAANQWMSKNRSALITTAWVLTELADGLAKHRTRHLVIAIERQLRSDSRFTVIAPSQKLFDDGLDLYRQRPDKDWSLTDCISFVVMRNHGITETLTADHHFEQAGFTALLK